MKRSSGCFSGAAMAVGCCLVAALAGGALNATPAQDLRAELERKAVVACSAPGTVPGTVGSRAPAEPLLFGLSGGIPVPVASASTLGRGRIVAVGHGGFVNQGVAAQNRAFYDAALAWLGNGKKPAKVWLDRSSAGMAAVFAAAGYATAVADIPACLASLPPDAVLVISPEAHRMADVPAMRAFVSAGGGVFVHVVGWGWHQLNPGKTFKKDSVYNALFAGTGLATDDRLLDPSGKGGFEAKPAFDPVLTLIGQWQNDPVRLWPAHPDAAKYPGLPAAGTERKTRTVTVNLAVPRRHGTGLFAVAGEGLTVALPEGAERLGLRLRIGATECRLSEKNRPWHRAPVVDVEVPLDVREVRIASPFGGPVYVVVPDGLSGKVAVRVGPACPMPTFKLGVDTPETWAKNRLAPAPYAELSSGKLVVTVPSADIRGIDDPAPMLKTWNEIIDFDAKLTGLPAARRYPERFCCDVQLCCGYMHAGYPIMIPAASAKHLVNDRTLRTASAGDVWGLFHEMGHNHQNYDWTFGGSVEVTVNFFTLYCHEKVCGIPPRKTRMGDRRIAERYEAWVAKGRPFEEWKKDPFMALEFFLRLQERFGWEAFEKMFAEYRALPDGERPKTDLDKRRQWAVRFSRVVGQDLSKEFSFMTEK